MSAGPGGQICNTPGVLAEASTVWLAVQAVGVCITAAITAILAVAAFRAYSTTKSGLEIATSQLGTASKQLEAALAQLKVDVLTRKADHERRQVESTFLYWVEVQKNAANAWLDLMDHLGTDELTKSLVATLVDGARDPHGEPLERKRHAEVLTALRAHLNDMERLAVGIQKDLMSFDYVDEVGNTIIRKVWRDSQPYIQKIRQEQPSGRQYAAFEDLYRRLDEAHRARQVQHPVRPMSYSHATDSQGE